MLAPNIIATHEKKPNSGRSSSVPSLMRPSFDRPTSAITTMARIMVMFSSQPALVMAQPKAADAVCATWSGNITPQAMKPTTSTVVTQKMILSRPKVLRWSSTPMPGTRPGCML